MGEYLNFVFSNEQDDDNNANRFVNEKYMIDQNMSVMIPNMYEGDQFIRELFHKLNIGNVKSIDFISNENYQRSAFIYMHEWYYNITVENLQQRILDDKYEAKIVYNDPDFWIVLPNYNNDHISILYNQITDLNKQMYKLTSSVSTLDHNISDSHKNLKKKNINNNELVNNSCCGAVSDAWVPSQPQKMNGDRSNKRKKRVRFKDEEDEEDQANSGYRYNLRPRFVSVKRC